MKLLFRLRLSNFRNYGEYEALFSPGLNLVIGRNGIGKTNLLEAVFVLVEGKSFRAAGTKEMIRHGEREAVVEGEFDGENRKRVKVVLAREGETARREPPGIGAVSFVPEDIFLVKGNPEWRRRFVDDLIRSLKPAYVELLREYANILRQRNESLRMFKKGMLGRSGIRSWNLLLVRKGMEIVGERKEALNLLERGLNREMGEWGMGRVEIRYYSSLAGMDEGGNLAVLERMEEAELRRGVTLVGPHRDEMVFLLEGRNLRREGSQGEQKMFSLAAKVTQAGIIRELKGEKTILLMDDCFSELDEVNRGRITETLRGQEQVIATSAEMTSGLEAERVLEIGPQGEADMS